MDNYLKNLALFDILGDYGNDDIDIKAAHEKIQALFNASETNNNCACGKQYIIKKYCSTCDNDA